MNPVSFEIIQSALDKARGDRELLEKEAQDMLIAMRKRAERRARMHAAELSLSVVR